MPPSAVLIGLLPVVSFAMSHSAVEVEGTDWIEPVLLWISISMPTGSGKSSLCKYLKKLVDETRDHAGSDKPSWFLDDQSFEKMGAIMNENHCKLMGLYDELAMFLSQINICRGKGVSDSHELAVFLQLYGANSWVRKTGKSSLSQLYYQIQIVLPSPLVNVNSVGRSQLRYEVNRPHIRGIHTAQHIKKPP